MKVCVLLQMKEKQKSTENDPLYSLRNRECSF